MEFNHHWSIDTLKRNTETGCVNSVHWRLVTRLDDLSAVSYGVSNLEINENPEIPYELLNEEIVLSWLDGVLEREITEEKNEMKILDKLQPQESTGVPW